MLTGYCFRLTAVYYYQPQKQQSIITAIRMIIQMLSSKAFPKQPAMDTPPYRLISGGEDVLLSATCCIVCRKQKNVTQRYAYINISIARSAIPAAIIRSRSFTGTSSPLYMPPDAGNLILSFSLLSLSMLICSFQSQNLFSYKIFSHIYGTCNKNYKAFNNILHILVNTQKSKTYEDKS